MLVDDDSGIRDSLSDLLVDMGYDITAVENGTDAMEILKRNPLQWSALITDFNMPNITGVELINQTRACGLHFDHVVLISAVRDLATLRNQLYRHSEKENVHILQKPFQIQSLLNALDDAAV